MECQNNYDEHTNLTEQDPNDKKKKKKSKIYSDAFPPNEYGDKQKNSAISESHKNFKNIKINENRIIFKEFDIVHLSEIKILHREWFPINYDDSFFERLLEESQNKKFYNLGAFYKFEEKDVIIGGIFCEIKNEMHLKRFIPVEALKKHEFSFIEDIINFTPDYEYVYIMTLGVIDECRRLKLGSKLLTLVEDFFKEKQTCMGIYLHVAEYNKTAIQFYLRNKFLDMALVKNYYKIDDEFYNGKIFVKFFYEEKMKAQNIVEILLIKPIKLLLFVLTFCMLCRCLRRKNKIT